MRFLVILAHPRRGSFNHAIARTCLDVLAEEKHEAIFHDLYAEGFEPVLPAQEISEGAALSPALQAHCDEITTSDGIIIIHPNWWGQPPAILKGWIDRVLRPGIAYSFLVGDAGDGVPVGHLKTKVALILNTSNTPHERELRVLGDPLEMIWKKCIFALCGVSDVRRKNFACVVTSTAQQRREWLRQVSETVRTCLRVCG